MQSGDFYDILHEVKLFDKNKYFSHEFNKLLDWYNIFFKLYSVKSYVNSIT